MKKVKKVKKIKCYLCPLRAYNHSTHRCGLGYVNPSRLVLVKEAAAVLGKDYICDFNAYKSEI